MDGFKAYRYYQAIKLHFTSPKYDVFASKGRVRGGRDAFESRNDRSLFVRLGQKFQTDKELIQYVASNFMYRNPSMVYDTELADANYKEYTRRRQSMTNVFREDLQTILNTNAQHPLACRKIMDVIRLLFQSKITIETLVILNDLDDFVVGSRDSPEAILLGEEMLRIQKSRGFVKYDSYKIMVPYQEFIEEIKGRDHGSHLS